MSREGRFLVIEHVPARVNEETGERLFAPETEGVDDLGQRLQHYIRAPLYQILLAVSGVPAVVRAVASLRGLLGGGSRSR